MMTEKDPFEAHKSDLEILKVQAETAKMQAETAKMQAEAKYIQTRNHVRVVLAIAGVGFAIVAIAKLLWA